MGIVHAQFFRLRIHHLRKAFFAARNGFRQSHASIVARLYNHAFDEVVYADWNFRVQEHA